jgi:large repetitive protein
MHSLIFNPGAGGAWTRTRALSFAAAAALLVLLLPATAGIASAHNHDVTATCTGGLSVSLSNYASGGTNTLNVWIDGSLIVGPDYSFGTSYSHTFPWSQTSSHTWEVKVHAYDSQTYSFDQTGTVAACKAHLNLVKLVSGGTASATSWTLSASAAGHTGISGTTPVSGDVDPATYTLSESGSVANYVDGTTWTCGPTLDGPSAAVAPAAPNNTVTLAAGDNTTCTITNTYVPPGGTITVIKALDFKHGGTLGVGDFQIHVTSGGNEVPLSPHAGVAGPTGFTYSLAPGTYTVTEPSTPTGYATENISCVQNEVLTAPSIPTNVVDLTSGASWTCTVTNTDSQPTLKVVKVVDNQNGGALQSSDFTLHVESNGVDVAGSPAAGSASGTTYSLDAGTYTVSEDSPPAGYQFVSATGDCSLNPDSGVISVNLAVGDSKTCTITNSDEPAHLTLIKHVSGGSATADQWTLSALLNQSTESAAAAQISGPGPQVGPSDVMAGTYTLSESGGPANYTPSAWSCDGGSLSGTQLTLSVGESATCTITNTYTPPPPPNQGFFYFTKTVGGNLNGWTGGTFSFTVTCNGQATSVSLTLPASGGSVSSQVFGPFTPGVTCSVSEGALPSAGDGASWVNSPTYTPSSSVTIVKNVNSSLTVTNTRTVTPPTTPPTTPPSTKPSPKPTPSGGVLGATGAPSLPPTSSVPGNGGSSDGNTARLLLAGLLGASLTLVVSTRLRGRLLEHIDH